MKGEHGRNKRGTQEEYRGDTGGMKGEHRRNEGRYTGGIQREQKGNTGVTQEE